jgi:hypothetical protein
MIIKIIKRILEKFDNWVDDIDVYSPHSKVDKTSKE